MEGWLELAKLPLSSYTCIQVSIGFGSNAIDKYFKLITRKIIIIKILIKIIIILIIINNNNNLKCFFFCFFFKSVVLFLVYHLEELDVLLKCSL